MGKIKEKKRTCLTAPWCGDGVLWSTAHVRDNRTRYWDYVKLTAVEDDVVWRDNKPFKAAFKVVKIVSSTSSAQMIMVNTASGGIFTMREVDFVNALLKTACVFGVFVGEWEIRKTGGKYYGLVFLG